MSWWTPRQEARESSAEHRPRQEGFGSGLPAATELGDNAAFGQVHQEDDGEGEDEVEVEVRCGECCRVRGCASGRSPPGCFDDVDHAPHRPAMADLDRASDDLGAVGSGVEGGGRWSAEPCLPQLLPDHALPHRQISHRCTDGGVTGKAEVLSQPHRSAATAPTPSRRCRRWSANPGSRAAGWCRSSSTTWAATMLAQQGRAWRGNRLRLSRTQPVAAAAQRPGGRQAGRCARRWRRRSRATRAGASTRSYTTAASPFSPGSVTSRASQR